MTFTPLVLPVSTNFSEGFFSLGSFCPAILLTGLARGAQRKVFVEPSQADLPVAEVVSQQGSCPLLYLSLKDSVQWGESSPLFPKGIGTLPRVSPSNTFIFLLFLKRETFVLNGLC